jgi:hypothetical protein
MTSAGHSTTPGSWHVSCILSIGGSIHVPMQGENRERWRVLWRARDDGARPREAAHDKRRTAVEGPDSRQIRLIYRVALRVSWWCWRQSCDSKSIDSRFREFSIVSFSDLPAGQTEESKTQAHRVQPHPANPSLSTQINRRDGLSGMLMRCMPVKRTFVHLASSCDAPGLQE